MLHFFSYNFFVTKYFENALPHNANYVVLFYVAMTSPRASMQFRCSLPEEHV